MTFSWEVFAAKVLPRLAGILAGYLVGEAAKRGLTLDLAQTTALMLAAYAAGHRLISRYTNPGDATRTALILKDKALVAAPAAEGVGAAPAPAQRGADAVPALKAVTTIIDPSQPVGTQIDGEGD
jgi:hypothetical protein